MRNISRLENETPHFDRNDNVQRLIHSCQKHSLLSQFATTLGQQLSPPDRQTVLSTKWMFETFYELTACFLFSIRLNWLNHKSVKSLLEQVCCLEIVCITFTFILNVALHPWLDGALSSRRSHYLFNMLFSAGIYWKNVFQITARCPCKPFSKINSGCTSLAQSTPSKLLSLLNGKGL